MRSLVILTVVLAGCILGSASRDAHSQPPERLPDLAPAGAATDPHVPYGVGKAPFAYRPATSCASASCHGGGEVGKRGSEHSTWAPELDSEGPSDPHNKAYRVLFNPVSIRMGEILKLTPHTDRRCLTCHAVDSGTDPATRQQIRSEGVGCSGCHGPADKWISNHYTSEWQTLTNRQKWDKYGFVPTKNLVARTLNCASCHVGDAERDMNHDFIAAGHPRLAFEAARFHAQPNYRQHWTEKTPQPNFEVRLWVVGQAATLRAAVNLLYERAKCAEANDANTPWPEFSGYSCYACHEKLSDTNVRRIASDTNRRAGVPGWEVWSNTAVGVAATSCELAFPGSGSTKLSPVKLPALDKLRELMGQTITPSATKVKEQAKAAVDELDGWLAALQVAEDRGAQSVDKNTPRAIAHKLATNALSEDHRKLADHDWDALAANYLGAAAMYYAAGKYETKEWTEPLLLVRDSLRFPTLPVGSGRFKSPDDRNLKKLIQIRDDFDFLRKKTASPEGK